MWRTTRGVFIRLHTWEAYEYLNRGVFIMESVDFDHTLNLMVVDFDHTLNLMVVDFDHTLNLMVYGCGF